VFEEFDGLPLHVLVVHAIVVLVPLTALTAIAYALVPRWRWLLRWPLLGLAVTVLSAAFVGKESGEAFRHRLGLAQQAIHEHAHAGERLFNVLLGLTVAVVVAAFALGGPSPLRSGRGAQGGAPRLAQVVVALLLVVASLAAGYQVYRTGDSGARSVWGAAGAP
jgi:hypothetical protein